MEEQMSIQQVSDRLGLPKSTLRFWEKAFHEFINPTRTAGGQRRYSAQDMKIIAAIREHKKDGCSLTQIKTLLKQNAPAPENVNGVDIDDLADKISATVRREILNFFKNGQPADTGSSGNGSGDHQ